MCALINGSVRNLAGKESDEAPQNEGHDGHQDERGTVEGSGQNCPTMIVEHRGEA